MSGRIGSEAVSDEKMHTRSPVIHRWTMVLPWRIFRWGHTKLTVTEQMNVGGKGINVSIVLKHLGIPTKILGFTAGFTGREIEKRIKEQEIEAEWIRLAQGDSRINVKLLSNEGTEINGQGPDISKKEVQELEEKLGILTKEDVLVLAGNVQKSLDRHFMQI